MKEVVPMVQEVIKDQVQVAGTGYDKDQAISNALANIQKKVIAKHGKIILRIEPLGVVIIKADEIVYTERFFFFFLPRKRKRYEITLAVSVDLSFIDTEKIEFTTSDQVAKLPAKVLGEY